MKHRLGLHVRLYNSLYDVVERVAELGLKKVQIFLMTQDKKYIQPSDYEIKDFRRQMNQLECDLIVHAGYWSHIVDVRSRGFKTLVKESVLAEKLGAGHIVIHPGAFQQPMSIQERVQKLSISVRKLLASTSTITFLFENISHKGKSFTGSLADYKVFFQAFAEQQRVQMCVDTAHAYAYGYDLKSSAGVHDFFNQLADIGYDRIGLIHANDTKHGLQSYLDEHAIPGQGKLGVQALLDFVHYDGMEDIPVIMELPEVCVEEERAVVQEIVTKAAYVKGKSDD